VTRRSLTAGVSLAVGVVLVCVMAVWGYHAMTAPIVDTTRAGTTSGPSCKPADQKVSKYVHRGDVTVSVYNAGKRAGRAQATLDLLERAGFKPGAIGNAPSGTKVARAQVYSTKADDPAAELVARALGKNTQVVHSDEDLGPGIDVVIGDKFKQLDPSAPRRLELAQPEVTCK
jgi:hypothetical protein